jgi:iron complex outermembrane receptor protein
MQRLSAPAGILTILSFSAFAQAQSPQVEAPPPSDDIPSILVLGQSPILGTGIDADKVPNSTRILRSSDLSHRGVPSLTGALDDQVGSVNLNQTNGNDNQPDFQFRGFTASPVEGTPAGIAVYQDGVRLNEAFGDTMNWDLVPAFAISSMDLTSTNPVFGFNALGGAVALGMKDGFTYQQVEAEAADGSFNRQTALLQIGRQWNHLAFYLGGEAQNDDGWRRANPSKIRQVYSDLGYLEGKTSLHLSFTGAENDLAGGGPTPEALLAVDRRAELSTPQSQANQLALVALHGTTELSQTWSLAGNAFVRNFNQKLLDGNPTNAQACSDPFDPTTVCAQGDDPDSPQYQVHDPGGSPVPTSLLGDNPGEIDYAKTASRSYGIGLQTAWVDTIGGHGNHLVFGGDLDEGRTKFNSYAELGNFDNHGGVLGTGVDISGGPITPVSLHAINTYSGVFLTDTFDVTEALAFTLAARYNDARIRLEDQFGGDLSGNHHYHRLNPDAGLTYKISPVATWYGNYAEANRAPTAAELSCADPAQSCTLSSFFVADPDLKQVVARTEETGVRGNVGAARGGRARWNLGLFRTDSHDDIIQVASQVAGKGYFQNAGATRRQGLEASGDYRHGGFRAGIDYSYVLATFQSALDLDSPHNPAADASGEIHVKPGDLLPGIPKQRLKVAVDYEVLHPWTVGTIITTVTSQVLRGDESNQNPQLGGYTLVNVHTMLRIGQSFDLWASVDNLFNRKYETFGTFTDATGIPVSTVPGGAIGQTRTVTPGAPLEAFAGVRYRI